VGLPVGAEEMRRSEERLQFVYTHRDLYGCTTLNSFKQSFELELFVVVDTIPYVGSYLDEIWYCALTLLAARYLRLPRESPATATSRSLPAHR
jgi:hypothetical protein